MYRLLTHSSDSVSSRRWLPHGNLPRDLIVSLKHADDGVPGMVPFSDLSGLQPLTLFMWRDGGNVGKAGHAFP